jgi:uncharacterized phage protein (TIGR01671 family)
MEREMREILFRGKQLDDGAWVCGYLFRYNDGETCIMVDEGAALPEYWVDPKTVGQFTGLLDKNGKKIFEGDIFKFKDEAWASCYTSCGTEYDSWEVENYGVVGFSEDLGRFDFVGYKFNENSVEADLHENNKIEFADFVGELEVIGNIHDNPELLEEDDFDLEAALEANTCYECGVYGDDYSTDENGEMVCNCDRCPYNSMNKED